MGNDITVYVSALEDSLRSKEVVLKRLLELTERQGVVLQEKMDTDEFDRLMQEKEICIVRIQELDKGFDNLFNRIGVALKANKEQYQVRILQMQDAIQRITDLSVKVQTAEKRNKELFIAFVSGKRKEIRDFKKSNKTAVSYYQNMANQHHEWQTYFLDKKK